MKQFFLLLFCITFCYAVYSQKFDYHWMMGSGSSEDTLLGNYFGTSRINFNYDPPTVYLEDTEMDFDKTVVSMSNIEGQLLFYTNGIKIHNVVDEPMLNSEDFNYNEFHEEYDWEELLIIQGLLSFQSGSSDNIYYILHLKADYEYIDQDNYYAFTKGLYYTTIDMSGDNSKGVVVEKGVPIVEDTLASTGGLTATRHANGRDWWILMPELNTHRYYTILLDPEGVHLKESQDFSFDTQPSYGQSAFSPDGNWFVRNSILGIENIDDHLDIFRFDRCTGQLSDHQHFEYAYAMGAGGGVVISPDSRFLYAIHAKNVFQFDLEADDIMSSMDTIGIYDGFLEGNFLPTNFLLGQNAPDGKIYINSGFGISFLHTIQNPNGQGLNSRFEQRSLDLPSFNTFSLPNFPNYRLGPIDGSPCDTLGINNLPLVAFNYYADSSDYLSINFWDYSYYEPTDWEWTFGDGATGSGQMPVHTYAGNGVYQVCLTASNEYGSDTLCKWLELGTTGIREILPEKGKLLVYPNPSNGLFTVALPDKEVVLAKVTLFNSDGRKVQEFAATNPIQIDGSRLPQSIYTIKVLLESGSILTEKIVIVR